MSGLSGIVASSSNVDFQLYDPVVQTIETSIYSRSARYRSDEQYLLSRSPHREAITVVYTVLPCMTSYLTTFSNSSQPAQCLYTQAGPDLPCCKWGSCPGPNLHRGPHHKDGKCHGHFMNMLFFVLISDGIQIQANIFNIFRHI